MYIIVPVQTTVKVICSVYGRSLEPRSSISPLLMVAVLGFTIIVLCGLVGTLAPTLPNVLLNLVACFDCAHRPVPHLLTMDAIIQNYLAMSTPQVTVMYLTKESMTITTRSSTM